MRKMTTHVIHNRPDGTAWLIVNQTPTGWELDDGIWLREIEGDADLPYRLEEEVGFWEGAHEVRRDTRLVDLGQVAREILRRDLAKYRPLD